MWSGSFAQPKQPPLEQRRDGVMQLPDRLLSESLILAADRRFVESLLKRAPLVPHQLAKDDAIAAAQRGA